MQLDAITIGDNPPEDLNVIIEVPIGGQPIKYELNKDWGTMVVDRFLYTPMTYPGNYGFVPHTLSEDGDPIDVMVCNTRPLMPGCVINVRPIGVLVMEDNAGMDEKIISVPSPHLTKRYEGITIFPTCRKSPSTRSSIFSSTTRTWNRASGCKSGTGVMPAWQKP